MDFLKKFKTHLPNPFLEKNLSLKEKIISEKNCFFQHVSGVSKFFIEDRMVVRFEKKDLILGLAVVTNSLCNPFSINNSKIVLNGRFIDYDFNDRFNKVATFVELYRQSQDRGYFYEFIIIFSNSSCFYNEKQTFSYIEDENFSDPYCASIDYGSAETTK